MKDSDDGISTYVMRRVIVGDSRFRLLAQTVSQAPTKPESESKSASEEDNDESQSRPRAVVATATYDALQRYVASRAAILFAIGMLTGFWSGAAMSGVVVVAIPRLALAAHLNCLLGCFWLLGFSFTLPMLSYSKRGKERLAKLMMVPTYGNWLITLLASFLGVRGVVFMGERKNDFIAVLLFTFVVFPALATSFAWVYGFIRKAP